MTVEELKLRRPNCRSVNGLIADWLAEDEKIREVRRIRLRQEIQKGIDQIERGESVECRNKEELRAFFLRVKARARERLAAARQSSAFPIAS